MTTLHDALTLPCGQVLPNRLMKSALSEVLGSKKHAPTAELERLYATWSNGGYGLIVTGNVMVDRTQIGEPGNVVIEDERDLDGLSRWAKTTQDSGTPIWMQINHPGRQANLAAIRQQPVAPSAVALKVPGASKPRELTGAEIEDIIERFATTAAVAETAGFNGVQVHGAHGYLVAQFLSPLANLRDDEWGGDPERRMRFVLEVVRSIRARVSPRLRRRHQAQLRRLPARRVHRGGVARRRRRTRQGGPRPDRGQRWQLRGTRDDGQRRQEHPRAGGVLPGVRPRRTRCRRRRATRRDGRQPHAYRHGGRARVG